MWNSQCLGQSNKLLSVQWPKSRALSLFLEPRQRALFFSLCKVAAQLLTREAVYFMGMEVGMGEGDILGWDGSDEGNGDRGSMDPDVVTSDMWVWAPSGIWCPQTTTFLDGSRSTKGSVPLKGIYFLWMLLLSLVKSLGFPVTLQMSGERSFLGIPSFGLWAELSIMPLWNTVDPSFP